MQEKQAVVSKEEILNPIFDDGSEKALVVVGLKRFVGMGLLTRFSSLIKEGIYVVAIEENDEAVENAKDFLRKNIPRIRGDEDPEETISNIIFAPNFDNVGLQAGLVLECAKEDIGTKRKVYKRVWDYYGENVLLFSTSFYPTTSLFSDPPIRTNCGNIHSFAPYHWPGPSELVVAGTEDFTKNRRGNLKTTNKMNRLLKSIGMYPIIVKDLPCFAGNRIFTAMVCEAIRIKRLMGLETGVVDLITANMLMNKETGEEGPRIFLTLDMLGINENIIKNIELLREEDCDLWGVSGELRNMAKSDENKWKPGDDEEFVDDDTLMTVSENMLGAILSATSNILRKKICAPKDIEHICTSCFGFGRGPFQMIIDIPKILKVGAKYERGKRQFDEDLLLEAARDIKKEQEDSE
jgi:3-hydroxyacyl-CoA dehydrogenase